MAIIALFLLGVGNFAILRAFLASHHAALAYIPDVLKAHDGRGALILEFVLLVGAMVLTTKGYLAAGIAYGAYAMLNGLALMWVVWNDG